jgi:hypothetical protein
MANDELPTGVCRPELSLETLEDHLRPPMIGAPDAASHQQPPEQLRPPAVAVPRREPRDEPLAEKDPVGLAMLGRFGCMTAPAIRFECYEGCKESNFSRRLHRWKTRGWVGVHRFLGMGANLPWLTQRGADVLVDGGHAVADELFPRTRVVAAKDLAHHLWIVDLALLALRGIPASYERVEPAWLVQRRHQPEPAAIPDLLLSSAAKGAGKRHLLAFEVDLATESLKVFTPKLEKLISVLAEWSMGGSAAVVILTRGSGRAASIERAVATLPGAGRVPMLVRQLPSGGSPLREALAQVIRRGDKSGEGVPNSAVAGSR